MADGFMATTLAFLGAIVLAVHVGQHYVRNRLRKWSDEQLANSGEESRYSEGYRDAVMKLQQDIVRREIVFHVKVDGEI